MTTELQTEDIRYKGQRYTIAFSRTGHKTDVLYHITHHANHGYNPVTVDAGKMRSKSDVMKHFMKHVRRV